ncbi:hypothetical protein K1T71_008775 [Dendrolimus kikuchii]|uniref:Uncharacterized protein n=1 Tax=Dendrolimus kikuchii TaxID=765133 RepID=A0ACC1CVJ5_9NEOP|nr:hypothetical protein K1T71_008775 [Dendrolimus kikuchii]
MATWSSRINLIRDPIESEIMKMYNKKPSCKIDPIGKLQIIHALDNGQCKTNLAKEYGVHPQTIAYIYKQKDSIIKKYTQKYNLLIQAQGINLDQSLLDWFKLEIKNGRVVHTDQLHSKAQEVINTLKEKFTCLDDWLADFRLRHNIVKYNTEIECSPGAKEEWNKFINNMESRDIYFVAFTALSHRLDFNSYINSLNSDSYISLMLIVNITGLDKRQLAVVGNEPFDVDSSIKSLPLDYYYNENPQINHSVIESYLKRWDDDLVLKGNYVYLILYIPDNIIDKLSFKNIRLLSNRHKDFVNRISEKVIACFKHQYRRLHICQSAFPRDCQSTLLDLFHMMSMAWNNVSHKYIHKLCFPPNDGSLYFKTGEDDDYGNHSLTDWCKLNEIPIEAESCSDSLEKYVFCDATLPCQNWTITNRGTPFINEMLLQRNTNTSAVEAFQAMKRLVSYLQGENAGLHIIKHAKYLEDHLEYGALVQMHEIVAANTNEIE